MKTLRLTKKDWKQILIEAAWEIAKPHLKKAADKLFENIIEKIKRRRKI